MKNKKGFTLIELLAVIAILSVLVIIALPNIMGLFNEAKKNSFTNEVKQIYNTAQQQWMTDSMFNTEEKVYSKCKTCTGKKLQLSGRQQIDYYVKVGKSGKIIKLYVTDGTYQFGHSGDLLITQINNVQSVANLNEDEVLNIVSDAVTIEPKSFSEDSWKKIVDAVRNNNTSVYNIGDTKTINLGTYGVHTIRIANKSTPSQCNTSNFSQTACGFVLEFVDSIVMDSMKTSDSNSGGWPSTKIRTLLNNNIFNSLPSDLSSNIITTKVISGHGSKQSTNFTSNDKIYLLSSIEVWNSAMNDTSATQTRQLDYYNSKGVEVVSSGGYVTYNNVNYCKKNKAWWLRGASSTTTGNFQAVRTDGKVVHPAATDSYGVSPAFRIG